MTTQTEEAGSIDTGRVVAKPAGPSGGVLKYLLPLTALVAVVAFWEISVHVRDIPHYILPSPSLIASELIANWDLLMASLWVTVKTTAIALVTATVGGVALAILISSNRIVEFTLYPYVVIVQVTPIIAIAPILLIYLEPVSVVLICAWIVAFFPILANTAMGLQSTDHNLADLYQLYGASRLQTLIHLRLPNALPYFLSGLRIGGVLALIGAVVAEFTAAVSGQESGLAWRLIESYNRLMIPRAFAALFLISLTGIAIFLVLATVQHLLLRKWHESAIQRER